MSSTSRGNGNAYEYGERVERWACDKFGMAHVDGQYVDARTSDGEPVQIKACQRWVSNGQEERARGRFTFWSDTLVYLLDGGQYLLAVYDPGREDLVERCRWIDPETIGRYCEGKWYDAHREKGDRARVRWNEVFEP